MTGPIFRKVERAVEEDGKRFVEEVSKTTFAKEKKWQMQTALSSKWKA
jgi:hypothetical protein